jgi:acetyl-CoA acetyltransferase
VSVPSGVIAIVGTGVEPFRARSQVDSDELARRALLRALDDAGVGLDQVGVWVFGSRFEHPGIGQRALYPLGATGPTILNTENACASGTLGLEVAAAYVACGAVRVAVVVGVERLSAIGSSIPLPEWDALGALGVTHPAKYALDASRYLLDHCVQPAALASVTVKNRRHAAGNPISRFDAPVSLEEVLASPMVADPLTRLQCCANADGAAAIVVTRADDPLAAGRGVRVLAIETGSGARVDRPIAVPLTRRLGDRAFTATGLTRADIDVAEVYDAFSILEVVGIESLGFAEPGTAAKRVAAGDFDRGTPGLVVNPGGGLLGRGHPLGASGVAQIVEIVDQLRDRAGERQVEGARYGLAQTLGGNLRTIESNAGAVVVLGRPGA